MDFQERKQATITVLEWLAEAGGDTLANWWLWTATPFPCALPLNEQLDEGLRLATGELSERDLWVKVEAELRTVSTPRCTEERAEQ